MQKLKIAIVTPGYPSNENGGFGFVHARAKLYAPKNEVKVFTISSKNSSRDFEGITVFLALEIISFMVLPLSPLNQNKLGLLE